MFQYSKALLEEMRTSWHNASQLTCFSCSTLVLTSWLNTVFAAPVSEDNTLDFSLYHMSKDYDIRVRFFSPDYLVLTHPSRTCSTFYSLFSSWTMVFFAPSRHTMSCTHYLPRLPMVWTK